MSSWVASPAVIWLCRFILAAYCALMIWIAHDVMAEWDRTMRLIESEAMCSASPLHCGPVSSLASLIIDVTAVELAILSEVARRWQYRHHVRVGAVVLGIGHLVANYVIIQIGHQF